MTTDGLTRLFSDWASGAEILAGLGVPPEDPVIPHARVCAECDRCTTFLFGDTDAEAGSRLAEHRRRCHD